MAIISADKINISGTLVRNTGGADKIVDGKEVEGGYFVCETLPSTGSYWTTGQLCYCTGDSQFYQYNGSTWEPANLGGGSSDLNIENGSGLGSVQSLGDYGTTGTSANTAVYVDENGKEVFNFNHGSNTNGVAAYKEATGDDLTTTPLLYGATGDYSQAIGGKAAAKGKRSRAEGTTTIALGDYSHAEGNTTVAIGGSSHAEGIATTAVGAAAHAGGSKTLAKGNYSFAMGDSTQALEANSTAIGSESVASGTNSFAGGVKSTASKAASLAFGNQTQAKEWTSVALNYYTTAVKSHSLAVGAHTKTSRAAQTVVGQANKDNINALFIVGNGDHDGATVSARSNAFEVLKDGGINIGSDWNIISSDDHFKMSGTVDDGGYSQYVVSYELIPSASRIKVVHPGGGGWSIDSNSICVNTNSNHHLQFPTFSGSESIYYTIATEEYVANYVANNNSGSSSGGSTVKYNSLTTTDSGEYPLLASKTSSPTSGVSYEANYVSSVKMNGTGQITASSFYATSDKRLKENIKEYTPKKSILDLPIVEFDFKNSGLHQIGCIAQDLQEICPEIVHTDNDGYLSVSEAKIVYLLLDEVKKLKGELEALKKIN